MSDIKYRKATSKDVTAISLLWAEHFDYHSSIDPVYKRKKTSEKDIAKFLVKAVENGDFFIEVVEDNKNIVGFIWCEINKKPPCYENRLYGFVNDIAVTKDFRGKGIAKELLKLSIPWFKTKKIKDIETRVLITNPLASKFWSSSGFKPFVNIMRYKL